MKKKSHNRKCYEWAVANQGFAGTFREWNQLSKREREEYEIGAGKP
jgi:hypothetical protein